MKYNIEFDFETNKQELLVNCPPCLDTLQLILTARGHAFFLLGNSIVLINASDSGMIYVEKETDVHLRVKVMDTDKQRARVVPAHNLKRAPRD